MFASQQETFSQFGCCHCCNWACLLLHKKTKTTCLDNSAIQTKSSHWHFHYNRCRSNQDHFVYLRLHLYKSYVILTQGELQILLIYN